MEKQYKYYAFISYKREDEEWAKWFQNELANYHLPSKLDEIENLPKEFRPVFRDVDELKAGNLPEQISQALETSMHLVVICSPRSAKSDWVNKEIYEFIEIGANKGVDNVKHVFPFIIEGIPHSGDEETECFPKALLELSKEEERIGGNVNEGGAVDEQSRERAFVKVLAGMLPDTISFDMLWDQYERDKIKKEREERERKEKLLSVQSRFLAEKVIDLIYAGDSYLARLLALEALPKDLDNPDRPYVGEAEAALREACASNVITIKNSLGDHYATISPNEKYILLYAKYVRAVMLWNLYDGALLWEYTEDSTWLSGAMFSPDSKRFITVGLHEIKIWDTELRILIRVLHIDGSIGKVSFSPDGHSLFICLSMSKTPPHHLYKVLVYDLQSEETISGFGEQAINPSSKICVSKNCIATSYGGQIHLWDTKDWHLIRILNGHNNYVFHMEFSADNKLLLSCTTDDVKLWDVETGKEVMSFDDDGISRVTFTPDEKCLLLSTFNGYIKNLNIENKEVVSEEQLNAKGVDMVGFSPLHNFMMLTWNNETQIYPTKPNNQDLVLAKHLKGVYKIEFSSDGQSMLSISDDCVNLWDWKRLKTIRSYAIKAIEKTPYGNNYRNLATFNPSGEVVAIVSGGDTKIDLYSTKDDKPLQSLVGHTHVIDCIKFSVDGNHLASVSIRDNSVFIWNIHTGIPMRLSIEKKEYCDAAFSPDGKRLAIVSLDGLVQVWDMPTMSKFYSFNGHSENTSSIEFSPDGKLLATTSRDETVKVWDATNGELVFVLEGHKEWVHSASFSPDGKYLVSTSNTVVKIWEMYSGRCVSSLFGRGREMFSARFNPDGRRVVYGSGDATIRIYEFVPLQELIDETTDRFKERSLDNNERRRYYLD